MSKHSQGPWEYREELRANMSMIVAVNQSVVVAGIPNETGDDLAVQRANARLISAAPVMLVASVNALPHIVDQQERDAIHDAIRAAIGH